MYDNPDLSEPVCPTHILHNTFSIPNLVRSRGKRSLESLNSDKSSFSMCPRIIAAIAAAIGAAKEVPLLQITSPVFGSFSQDRTFSPRVQIRLSPSVPELKHEGAP